MQETYERQLAGIVEKLPDEPAIIALVPTIPLEEAAALASDVAQIIGSSRGGHTILTSFESTHSALDHEIGVEGSAGLTDVLSKDATMVQVAAHGRARHFIYVPAGSSALAGDALLRSDAWRALSESTVRRGGTILAFVPAEAFEAVHAGDVEEAGRRFDALIWLGPARGPGEGVRRAAIASGARDLGHVVVPTGPGRAREPTAAPTTDGALEDSSTSLGERGAPSSTSTVRLEPGSFLVKRGRHRRQVAKRRSRVGIPAAVISLAIVGATVAYVAFGRSAEEPGPAAEFAAPDSAAASDSVPGVAEDSVGG